MKNTSKKVLKTVGAIGITASSTYFILGSAIYYATLTKNGLKNPYIAKIASGNKNPSEEKLRLDSIKKDGGKWFDSANREKLIIKSTNYNKNLYADFIFPENESDVFVIIVHGYTSEPRGMGIYAKEYHNKGYNVLLPSLNGHGDSESNRITMGWHDRLDVIDWVNYISENYPESKIIIHGESMGSATTMMATGESLPDNVKAAIADCGYTSVWDIMSNKITDSFKLHEFPTLYCLNSANKIYSGFDFKTASAVEQIKKSKTPTIFIHGDKDKFVPYEMLDKVYEAASCEKEKVTIPDSPHARNACKNPELYWNSIFNFISRYI